MKHLFIMSEEDLEIALKNELGRYFNGVDDCDVHDMVSRILNIAANKADIQSLLNKVNKVTAPFRHTGKVSDKALTELCNRQIDFENVLNHEIKEKK